MAADALAPYVEEEFQLPASYPRGEMTQNVNICLCSFWKKLARKGLMESQLWSSNGLVPSGNKPLPEPMMTQFYVFIVFESS